MGLQQFASPAKGAIRSVTTERAVAAAWKVFDPKALTVTALEFWTDAPADAGKKADVVTSVPLAAAGLSAREAVVANLEKIPEEKWFAAVAVYSDGSRQATLLKDILDVAPEPKDIDLEKLTNSNSYSDPNFNIDTSTNVAGLTALKGSAPAATDNIFVYAGATLTIESACTWLMLSVGETSGGACANAADRVGHLTVNPGVTASPAGNATATNSGIKSVPASAALNPSGTSVLTLVGSAGSLVTLTNGDDAYGASGRYIINWTWGKTPRLSYVHFKYPYGTGFFTSGCLGGNNINGYDGPINWHHLQATGFNAGTFFNVLASGTDYGVEDAHRIHFTSFDLAGGGGSITIAVIATAFTTGGQEVRVDSFLSGTGAGGIIPLNFSGAASTTFHLGTCRMSGADISPTEIMPTTLASADAGTGGTLTVTWANAASYKAGELVVVKVWKTSAGEGTAVYRFLDATLGTGKITGLEDGAEHTLKAYATTDNYITSAYTATTTGTPTHAGYDFPAVTSVLDTDTVDEAAGTYKEAVADIVKMGELFGPDSSYVGNLLQPTNAIINFNTLDSGGRFTAAFPMGEVATLDGDITFLTDTTASIILSIYDPANHSIDLINDLSVAFTGGVTRTLADIAGEALEWTPAMIGRHHAYLAVYGPDGASQIRAGLDALDWPAAGELKAGVLTGFGEIEGTRTDADPAAVLDTEDPYGDPDDPLVPAFDLDTYEQDRNELPDRTKIPTQATGGPAPWLHLGVSREGSLNLDNVKLLFEAERNSSADPTKYLRPETFNQFGEQVIGLYVPPASGAPIGGVEVDAIVSPIVQLGSNLYLVTWVDCTASAEYKFVDMLFNAAQVRALQATYASEHPENPYISLRGLLTEELLSYADAVLLETNFGVGDVWVPCNFSAPIEAGNRSLPIRSPSSLGPGEWLVVLEIRNPETDVVLSHAEGWSLIVMAPSTVRINEQRTVTGG
jgi:hypothetical protein